MIAKIFIGLSVFLIAAIAIVVFLKAPKIQKLTFIEPNEYSPSEQAKLQKILNDFGDPAAGLSFVGYRTRFDNGSLYVDGFFRNNTGEDIYNIYGDIYIKTENEIIASDYYMFFEPSFPAIENNYSVPYSIVFKPSSVFFSNVELEEYSIKTVFDYNIK